MEDKQVTFILSKLNQLENHLFENGLICKDRHRERHSNSNKRDNKTIQNITTGNEKNLHSV